MRLSYLGKIVLRWCDHCSVPVLGKRCACGAETREVPVTPPGDIRPAFQADIDHINSIFEEYFGLPLIPEGHIAVLNKIPDKDRMEEIVMGGAVVAALRYLPDEDRWEPLPRPEAASYLTPAKRYVVVDDGAIESIRSGSSVLAPGLVGIDDHVAEGDEVFILDREGACVGVGRARMDAATAREAARGAVTRTRKNRRFVCVPGEASWDDAVAANAEILARVEAEAIGFVKNVAEKNPLPANVSYSGGKDSLATLLIVMKAIEGIPILFADTGLEFPETYANVDDVAGKYGLEVIRTGSGANFWEAFERLGPPAVDERWCCKVCKLQPVKDLIREQWGECLSFIGQRKYESFARMKSPRVWRNRFVEFQLSAAPIQHWTALHVWLYLFRENAPHNVLYEQRIDRIGCFMCPSSDRAVFETIRERYPELWSTWDERMRSWQLTNSLPDEWREEALWRRRGDREDDNSSYT